VTAELPAGEGIQIAVAALAAHREGGWTRSLPRLLRSAAEAVGVNGDLTVREDVDRALAEAPQALGPPDIAVNNAGGPHRNFNGVTDQDFTRALEQMTTTSMVCLIRATPTCVSRSRAARSRRTASGRRAVLGVGAPTGQRPSVRRDFAEQDVRERIHSPSLTFNTFATGPIGRIGS
jgi:NAD(P)-dependent dehydrogenase (short-subunit alcohol dehydrogenase family)